MSVCVEDDDLPDVIWRVKPHGHLLAPLDAVRTSGGTAALLPACRGRLRGEDATTPGRAVTIAVSIVRGAGEAALLDEDAGSWWVDADGRPVLALGSGGSWREEAAGILSEIAATAPGALSQVLPQIALGILDTITARRSSDAWEDALFAAAEPQPLSAPESPGASAAASVAAPMRALALRRDATAPDAGADTLIERLIDADLVRRTIDAVAGVRTGAVALLHRLRPLRKPAESRERRHRGPLLAAAAVVSVVVMFGILWPGEAGPPSAAASPAPSTSAAPDSGSPSAPPVDAPKPAPVGEASALERGARAALELLSQCVAGEADACIAVREDPSLPLPEGLVGSDQPISGIDVIDEYGGVAVIRATATGYASQAVVLVQVDERWLVRDVYDLADQP